MNTSLFYSLVACAVIPLAVAVVGKADGQTSNGEPLSMIEIVQKLEKDGYGPFTEVELDDGNWEVEARKEGESLELTVEAVSGKVLSEHRDDSEAAPAKDAMALSKLLQKVSDDGDYELLDEVSFERRYWEIEVHKDGQRYELHVDPISAEVIAERIDD